MDFFSERTVMRDAGLTELPGKIDLPAVVRAEEFNVSFFNTAEKAAHREDRFHVFGKSLDRLFKFVDAGLQVVLSSRETVRVLRRANELVHEKKVVGAAIDLFFIAEMLEAFFKPGQKRVGFPEGEGSSFFMGHGSVLLTG